MALSFSNHVSCADPAALKEVLKTFADNGARVFDAQHGNAAAEQFQVTTANELGIQNKLFWSVRGTPGAGPSGPADSASLHDRLLEATQRKDIAQGADRKIKFTIQMLEVRYENKPAPVSLAVSKRKASGFRTTRTGNLVLIQPGENAVRASEPLSLYGMMGHKIAVLHPTGYVYQWNGKTSAGAEAPTGVYFVQSGSRILGKFFYTR